VPTHVAIPKREGYTQYTMAEKDPEAFSRELIQKLSAACRLSPEERLPKNINRPICCCQLFLTHPPIHLPSCQQGNQQGNSRKSVFGSAVDGRALETQLKRAVQLGEASQAEPTRLVLEEPEHDQSILGNF